VRRRHSDRPLTAAKVIVGARPSNSAGLVDFSCRHRRRAATSVSAAASCTAKGPPAASCRGVAAGFAGSAGGRVGVGMTVPVPRAGARRGRSAVPVAGRSGRRSVQMSPGSGVSGGTAADSPITTRSVSLSAIDRGTTDRGAASRGGPVQPDRARHAIIAARDRMARDSSALNGPMDTTGCFPSACAPPAFHASDAPYAVGSVNVPTKSSKSLASRKFR